MGVLKDTNFALVSTAPARLHCYLLEKAQFVMLKPVLYTRLPVFFFFFCSITADLSKTLVKCCDIFQKRKNKWSHWGLLSLFFLGSPCAPLAAVQSFSLPRSCWHSGKYRSTQHLNHCSSYVSCRVLSSRCPPHLSRRVSKPSGSFGGEVTLRP